MKNRLSTALILVLLFLATWAPRVPALKAFVTPDEPAWLYRSANFYQAITHADFASTYQHEQPGVTATWAGTLSFLQHLPGYAQDSPGQLTGGQLDPWLLEHTAIDPLELLASARWWIVLWISLIITSMYFPLRRLFGKQLATLAVLVIAWDPFLIALSRQLHLDGLLASLSLLALLAFITWLYVGQQRRYLIISGLATGLALLTKVPAIVLMPAAGLLVLVEWYRRVRNGEVESLSLLLAFVAWVALVAVTVFCFWPALWVDSANVLKTIVAGMRVHAAGHDTVNFFWGLATEDPGPFFYPVAYLFRSTPISLIGLVAAVALGWRRRWPLDLPIRRRATLGLVVFSLLFTVIMTAGAKKFDRYLSPALLALDVVAALGVAGMVHLGLEGWDRMRSRLSSDNTTPSIRDGSRRRGWVVAVLVLSLHGSFAYANFPYYFTCYNPLAGGSWTAPDALLVGWGEGLDAAAGWLKQQPDAANMRVVSWYSEGPLSYFLQPGQTPLSFYSTDELLDADYVVLYVNQWQRGLPSPELVDYYLAREPAHVVRSGGLELARIYDVRNEPPPGFTNIVTSSAADFGDRMRLAAYRLEKQTVRAGDQTPLTLYLKRLVDDDVAYNALLRLVAPDGGEVWRDEGWPAGAPTTSWPIADVQYDDHVIAIPGDAAPGRYSLMLSFYDPSTGELLPVAGGVSHQVASIEVKARGEGDRTTSPATPGSVQPGGALVTPRVRSVEVNARWDVVRLNSLQFTKPLSPGQTLHVELSAEGQVDGSLKMSFRLVDSSGKVKAQNDQKLWPYTRAELDLPGDVQSGTYTLTVVLYDQETLGPFPDSAGSFLTALSEVEVVESPAE